MLTPDVLLTLFGQRQAPDGTLAGHNFANWFKDSKAIDVHGVPLTLYHGTSKAFDSFRIAATGEKDVGWYGRGIYVTADPNAASAYAVYESLQSRVNETTAACVMPLHASLQNPYFWPAGKKACTTHEETLALTHKLVAQGFDGVIISNDYADPAYASHYEVVVFSPTQLKSAIGNSGRFDPTCADMLDRPAALLCAAKAKEWVDAQADNSKKKAAPC